jgi:tRNA A-37 threonylcarbamoyl transferase component Bud32
MNLEDIQDRILEQLHEGEPIDRAALLTEHEEHADALEQFFGVLDIMEAEGPGQEDAPSRLGEFRIVREIGRGGMGIVFEAEQTSLKRRVALKVLPTALRSDRRLLSRFRREAEAAARLRHPNIVPVYSIGQAGNAPFFAMEMVTGQSLAEALDERRADRDGGLPQDAGDYQRRCVEVVSQLADALAYAHSQGILHRDVKPANVLLEADGTPRLTDFGLAADLEASSLTVSGEVFGSPRYMSPEQAFRCEKPLDARTDVYSLGVTLYEMLTLRLPYQGTTMSELLAALSTGQVVSPREFGIEMPAGLERVLMRALCRDLDERYAGVAEFAEDLRAASEGRSVKPRRWLPYPKLTAALMVLTVVVSAVGTDWAMNGSELPTLRRLWRGIAGDGVERASWEQIEALADGKPQPDDVMGLLFQPSVKMTPVLVRDVPFPVQAKMAVTGSGVSGEHFPGDRVPEIAAGQIAIVCLLEYSINGGEWQYPDSCGVEMAESSLRSAGVWSNYVSYDGNDYFDGEEERDSLRLQHRITIRVFRLEEGQHVVHGQPLRYEPGQFPFNVEAGTCRQWTLPEELVFCYDDYPADYPEALSDPELRDAAHRTLMPEYVKFEVRRDALFALVRYPFGIRRSAVPLAGDLDLLMPGSDEVIASAQWRFAPEKTGTGGEMGFNMSYASGQSQAQQRFLLTLSRGDLREVRLVLRPSRAVALKGFPMSRYWAEPVDVTVPVRKVDGDIFK